MKGERSLGWKSSGSGNGGKVAFFLMFLAVTIVCAASEATANGTYRVSIGSVGQEGISQSNRPVISANGRFVAFQSQADNLVPGDTNGSCDIFVRDLLKGTTKRVSVDSLGNEGDSGSQRVRISGDGRLVVFASEATNLVPGDTNGVRDIFVHDRLTGKTTRVSVDLQGNEANDDSWAPDISADGLWVAFESLATNLVPGDGNGAIDIFLHDLTTGETTRVSAGHGGAEANDSSCWARLDREGRWVIFSSWASNLVPNDTNATADTFIYRRATGVTGRVSLGTGGVQGNGPSGYGSISNDGRWVAFESAADNFAAGDLNMATDVFLRDLATGTTTLVSRARSGGSGGSASATPTISRNGMFIVFVSSADDLVADDTGHRDIFVYNRWDDTIRKICASVEGIPGDQDDELAPDISGDGRLAVYASRASNLVPGDTNNVADVFVTRAACLPKCDLDQDGSVTSLDQEVFINGCSRGVAGWICDLDGDGRFTDWDVPRFWKRCETQ